MGNVKQILIFRILTTTFRSISIKLSLTDSPSISGKWVTCLSLPLLPDHKHPVLLKEYYLTSEKHVVPQSTITSPPPLFINYK